MAGSPLDLFRKNQKLFMVVLTCMAMFSFVFFDQSTLSSGRLPLTLSTALVAMLVGGAMYVIGLPRGKAWEYGLGGAAVGAVATVIGLSASNTSAAMVQTSFASYTDVQLRNLRQRRQTAERFAHRVADPSVRFTEFDPRTGAMFGGDDNDSVLMKELYLQEAKKLGIVLDDEAVNSFLMRITGNKGLTTSQFLKAVRDVRSDEMTMFSILKEELTAKLAEQLTQPPMAHRFMSDTFALTPEQYWDEFKKLNVKEQLQIASLPVESFVSQVKDPDDATLATFFEKYRSLAPAQNGTPGFLMPPKISLGVLSADFTQFESKVARPTEEELKAYYEQNKPRFRAPPLPDHGGDAAPADALAPQNAGPALPGETTPPKAEEPTADEKPAETSKPVETPKPDTPAEAPKPEEPKSESPKPEAPKSETPVSDAAKTDGGTCEYVGPVEETAEQDDKPALPEIVPASPVTPEKPQEPSKPEEAVKPAEPADKTAPAKPETPAVGAPKAETPAAAVPPSPTGEPPKAPTVPSLDSLSLPGGLGLPSGGLGGVTGDLPESFLSFDEARSRVEEMILRERASAALEKAMQSAAGEVEAALRSIPVPQKEADFKASAEKANAAIKPIAEKFGLTYEETALLTQEQFIKKPVGTIGSAFDMVYEGTRLTPTDPVAAIGFQVPAYQLRFAQDFVTQTRFLWWVREFERPRPPALTEPGIREQVLAAWKTEEARKLAQARAEEILKAVKADKKPFAETIAAMTVTGKDDGEKLAVKESNRFSWYVPAPFDPRNPRQQSGPMFSTIDGIPRANEEVFKTVFQELNVGDVGLVKSADGSSWSVVSVLNRDGVGEAPPVAMDQLRNSFMALKGELFGAGSGFGPGSPYQVMNQYTAGTMQAEQAIALQKQYDLRYVGTGGLPPDSGDDDE